MNWDDDRGFGREEGAGPPVEEGGSEQTVRKESQSDHATADARGARRPRVSNVVPTGRVSSPPAPPPGSPRKPTAPSRPAKLAANASSGPNHEPKDEHTGK